MNVRLETKERVYIKDKIREVDEAPRWTSPKRVEEKVENLHKRDFSTLIHGVVRSMNKINDQKCSQLRNWKKIMLELLCLNL